MASRATRAMGDYDESSLFSIAAARLMASIAAWRSDERTIAIFNEWQTAMGLLYLRQQAPSVRTLFITHAHDRRPLYRGE